MDGLQPERSVLIADDDRAYASRLASLLSAAEYEVKTASAGPEAREWIEDGRFAVILLDPRVSHDGDRFELLRRARALAPQARVIIHSATATADVGIEAMRSGAHAFVAKPSDEALMVERIKAAANNHSNLLQSELQRQSTLDALARLASGVTSDLNNVLSAISCSTELLHDLHHGRGSTEEILEIDAAVARAASLTRQLLTFSQREVVKLSTINVADTITGLSDVLHRLLPENVRLAIETEGAAGVIRASHRQIEQVIINLLANATDAMPDGGEVTIGVSQVTLDDDHVRTFPELSAGDFVVVTVTDTGRGMSRRAREHLFEPFFTTKTDEVGAGLGMSLAYGVVRQCRGRIGVDSELGAGTTITVYLPLHVDNTTQPDGSGGSSNELARAETILLVDDNPAICRAGARLLASAGYKVVQAKDAACALAADELRQDVALIITDVSMPGMNGMELARRARELRPGIPILYMSGNVGVSSGGEGLLEDRALFQRKPFTRQQLLAKVRALLDDN